MRFCFDSKIDTLRKRGQKGGNVGTYAEMTGRKGCTTGAKRGQKGGALGARTGQKGGKKEAKRGHKGGKKWA